MERKGERRSGLRHEEPRRSSTGSRARLWPLSRPPEAASPSPLAPRLRHPREPAVPAPQSAAPRPGRRGLMAGPSLFGRAGPGSRRAPRAARPALGPQPQAPSPCALAPLPPPSYIGPSSIPLSRSARAPGPKEKDQGQEGQSPKEVSLVPQQTALCVSSGTSSSYRVVRLGRARGSGGSPQPLPATWLLGRCVIRPPGTMWKVAGSLGSGLQERPGACPAPLPNSIEEAQMWAGGRSWQSLPGCM